MALRGVVGSPAHITRRGPTAPGDKQASAERLTREAGDEQHPGKAGCTRDSLGALGHGLPLRPRPRRCCWRPSASRAAKRYRRARLPVPTRGEMPTRPPRGTAGDRPEVPARADETLRLAAQAPGPDAALANLTPRGALTPRHGVTAATVLGREAESLSQSHSQFAYSITHSTKKALGTPAVASGTGPSGTRRRARPTAKHCALQKRTDGQPGSESPRAAAALSEKDGRSRISRRVRSQQADVKSPVTHPGRSCSLSSAVALNETHRRIFPGVTDGPGHTKERLDRNGRKSVWGLKTVL